MAEYCEVPVKRTHYHELYFEMHRTTPVFGVNTSLANYCLLHHKAGHFCPMMRPKEIGKNLDQIGLKKSHLLGRFSTEIHFCSYPRSSRSTFCLLNFCCSCFEEKTKSPAFRVLSFNLAKFSQIFSLKTANQSFFISWFESRSLQ